MDTTTLTTAQAAKLREAGQRAHENGHPNAPAMTAAWHEVCAQAGPVGASTALLHAAADAFHTGYALASQRLATIAALLDLSGCDYDVENTGGYVMAVVVRLLDGTVWVVTQDEEALLADPDATAVYNVFRYEDAAWNSLDGNDPLTADSGCTEADVLALIDFDRTATPFA